ncbi:MAG: hypothetical protein WC796_04535 [Candidatus Pacearchaeota archaeon]|jgi:hypothetical protein
MAPFDSDGIWRDGSSSFRSSTRFSTSSYMSEPEEGFGWRNISAEDLSRKRPENLVFEVKIGKTSYRILWAKKGNLTEVLGHHDVWDYVAHRDRNKSAIVSAYHGGRDVTDKLTEAFGSVN